MGAIAQPSGGKPRACKFDHEDAAVEVPSARLLILAKKENKITARVCASETGRQERGGREGELVRLKREWAVRRAELILVARLNLPQSAG